MKTIQEWIESQSDDITSSQLDQLITRLEGLLYGLGETQKTELIDKFMRQVEERILGL